MKIPALILLAALTIAPSLSAQTVDVGLYEQKDEGFVSLFDGKTLDGWSEIHKFGPPYFVTNGVIASPPDAGNDLVTEKTFADFVLRMDFKLTPGANNGVGIRTPFEKANLTYVGNEIQILDDNDQQYTNLEAGQYCGSLYKVFAARRGALNKVGEWNHYEITVQGRHFKIVLNGKTIVDGNVNGVADPDILRKHPGLLRDRGHIALLGHSSYVEFRNIFIKELPPPDPSALPEGFAPLFETQDLTKWQSPGESGVLFLDDAGTNLSTPRNYHDFEMLMDWKVGPGGSGAVCLRGMPAVRIDSAGGSGALWKNVVSTNSPLKRADNPVGEWNRFRILLVSDKAHVFLNNQLVVRNTTLDNAPSAGGPIALQCDHGPIWIKNVYIREIATKPQTGNSSSPE
jgi:hypothetical protein